MLFNSFAFALFLPLVFVAYWWVFKKLKSQNAFIVVASYVFYLPFYMHFVAPQGGVGARLATTSLAQFFVVVGAFLTPIG